MSEWVKIYLAVFAAGCAMTLLLTPFFRWIAGRTGFLDRPNDQHKGHRRTTPLLGGMAMFCAWMVCLCGALAAVRLNLISGFGLEVTGHLEGFRSVAAGELGVIVSAAALAVILGLLDDRKAMSAGWKFAGQFLIALFVVGLGGVRINLFIGGAAGIAISVFWIMLLMNSINFFDNMDGLAVGTIAIAMFFFALLAALNGQFFMASFSALACGVCCGFWYYNSTPATIFMGDSGSHFLGFLAAVVSARVTYFDLGWSQSRFPVLIPLFILALPLFDTAMVVLIRTLKRRPFWIGDHNHISHRFVRMGLSRRQAVLLVHLLAFAIGLGMLPVYWGDFSTALVLVIQSLLILGVVTLLQFKLSERPDAREQ